MWAKQIQFLRIYKAVIEQMDVIFWSNAITERLFGIATYPYRM